MLMILARVRVRSESFWAAVKVRSPGVGVLERSLRSRVGACSRLRSCDRGGDSDFAPKAPRDRVGRLEIAKWREKRVEILFAL